MKGKVFFYTGFITPSELLEQNPCLFRPRGCLHIDLTETSQAVKLSSVSPAFYRDSVIPGGAIRKLSVRTHSSDLSVSAAL